MSRNFSFLDTHRAVVAVLSSTPECYHCLVTFVGKMFLKLVFSILFHTIRSKEFEIEEKMI